MVSSLRLRTGARYHGEAVDGVGPDVLETIAASGKSLDLAAWGTTCIEDAIRHMGGKAVGWPADLNICRLDQGLPITLVQRVTDASAAAHPPFTT